MNGLNDHSCSITATCVIPAWNASATIERALTSALTTPGVSEAIVVDDGSTDNTASLVEALAVNAPLPVRLIRQDNAGAAVARNTGMRYATCGWIIFLDADDEMLREAISSKAAHLASCPDPESVYAVHGSFVRGDTGTVGQFAETRDQVDRDGIGRSGGFPGGVVSYAFRREPLLATGGFSAELKLYEDFELILRFIKGGARVVGCNVPGFYRHYTPNSLSRGTAISSRLRIERQFLAIALRHGLLSRKELARRYFGNRAQQLLHTFKRLKAC